VNREALNEKIQELSVRFAHSLYLDFDKRTGNVSKKTDFRSDMDTADPMCYDSTDDQSDDESASDETETKQAARQPSRRPILGAWSDPLKCSTYGLALYFWASQQTKTCMPISRLSYIATKWTIKPAAIISAYRTIKLGCAIATAFNRAKGPCCVGTNKLLIMDSVFPRRQTVMSLLRYAWETIRRKVADYWSCGSSVDLSKYTWTPIPESNVTVQRLAWRLQLTYEYLFQTIDATPSSRLAAYVNDVVANTDGAYLVISIFNMSVAGTRKAGSFFSANRLNRIMHHSDTQHTGNEHHKQISLRGFDPDALFAATNDVLSQAEMALKVVFNKEPYSVRKAARERFRQLYEQYERSSNKKLSISCLLKEEAIYQITIDVN
jgi:hypothetical protein